MKTLLLDKKYYAPTVLKGMNTPRKIHISFPKLEEDNAELVIAYVQLKGENLAHPSNRH